MDANPLCLRLALALMLAAGFCYRVVAVLFCLGFTYVNCSIKLPT